MALQRSLTLTAAIRGRVGRRARVVGRGSSVVGRKVPESPVFYA